MFRCCRLPGSGAYRLKGSFGPRDIGANPGGAIFDDIFLQGLYREQLCGSLVLRALVRVGGEALELGPVSLDIQGVQRNGLLVG